MRTYERTHPWITFREDLKGASPKLWMLLGEARSKCDHLAWVPLKPEFRERLHSIYLAKGAQATTAIEGNTLTEDQVAEHLKGRLDLPESKEYLGREIDNVVGQINAIYKQVMEAESEEASVITPEEVCAYNEAVLKALDNDEHVRPGEVRQTLSVAVGAYRGAPPEDCDFLLGRYCEWLNGLDLSQDDDLGVIPAIIRAVAAHLYLAWIHPFGDGNGRTARLIEFKILVSGGVPTVTAHLLSNHYNQTRTQYVKELSRASSTENGFLGFLLYAVAGFVDQLVEQIDFILDQQFMIAWKDYVYETFRGAKSVTRKRQRDLLLAMTDHDAPVEYGRIASLTTDLAFSYGRLTKRTLLRDLKALSDAKLIRLEDGLYRPNFALLVARLPGRRRLSLSRYLNPST